MASRSTWVEVLGGLKMLYDLVKFGPDHTPSHLTYLGNPETYAEACRVSEIFSTYLIQMEALLKNIEVCRDRLIQGKEKDRARCLCNIFNQIKAENGGTLPLIDDWQRMYDDLGCDSKG
jgi:hypothetical protein